MTNNNPNNKDTINSNDNDLINQTENNKRDYLLTDESFKRLRKLQEDIYAITEMTPSFRKLINALITDENIELLKSELLSTLNN